MQRSHDRVQSGEKLRDVRPGLWHRFLNDLSMSRPKTIASVLLVAALLTSAVGPAVAAPVERSALGSGDDATQVASQTNENATVEVTAGKQLSTIVATTSDDVESDFEDAAFEFALERSNASERGVAAAERAATLRERAEEIREEYESATAAYEADEIDRSEYARELATLNARAENLRESYRRFDRRTETVSERELRSAGANRTALERAVAGLDPVTGPGQSALAQRFTGETEGELELETANGVSVEFESEDGERSREFERPRDDDDSITVNRSVALETARANLSDVDGEWRLESASVKEEDGYYEFEFVLEADGQAGELEIRVDGSSNAIFRLEEEIERSDDRRSDDRDDERRDDDREDGALEIRVVEGTPEPGATVTVHVLAGDEAAADVLVTVDGERVGTTDAGGTLTVTLPDEETEITAERGDVEAELELEFETDGDERDGEDDSTEHDDDR